MKRFLLLFLLVAAMAWGQGSNTIIQTLVMGSTSSAYTSGLIRNIGQAFHQVFLNVAALPAHVCNVTTGGAYLTVDLQGSHDNVNFVSVPSKTNRVNTQLLLQGAGSFPFLRLVVIGLDTANCQFSAYYSGSVAAAQPQDPQLVSQTASSSAIGNTTVVGAGFFYGTGIYGLVISNATAGQTVTLNCPAGGGSPLVFNNLAAGATIVVPVGPAPWLVCAPTSVVNMNISAATAVNLAVLYRATGQSN